MFVIIYCAICALVSFVFVSLFAIAKKVWLLIIPSLVSLLSFGYLLFWMKYQEAIEDKLPNDYYSHPFSVPSTGTYFILMLATPIVIFISIWTIMFYKINKE